MKKAFLFIIIIIGTTSCEGFLTETYPIYQENVAPLLVLNSVINTNDSIHYLYIGRNQAYSNEFDPNPDLTLPDASCKLLVGGQTYDFEFIDTLGFYQATLDKSLQNSIHEDLQIVASHPDFNDAVANVHIPEIQENFSIELSEVSDKNYQLKITINDTKSQPNYYMLSIVEQESRIRLDEDLPFNLEFPNQKIILFNDETFNGQNLLFTISCYIESLDSATLHFSQVSESFYKLESSLIQQNEESSLTSFSQISNIYSNIDGGLGAVSIVNTLFVDLE